MWVRIHFNRTKSIVQSYTFEQIPKVYTSTVRFKLIEISFRIILQKRYFLQNSKIGSLIDNLTDQKLILNTYFFDSQPLFLIVATNLCIFEGLIHIAGIWLAKLDAPYTPGMITAELELVAGIYVYAQLANSGLLHMSNIIWGVIIFIACFVAMQRSLLAMTGKGYGDVIKTIKSKKSAWICLNDIIRGEVLSSESLQTSTHFLKFF